MATLRNRDAGQVSLFSVVAHYVSDNPGREWGGGGKILPLIKPRPTAKKNTCECPAAIPLDKLVVKPKYRTPVDRFGFPMKFCFCCSTRVASGFICLAAFVWGGIELQCADKNMTAIFPDKGNAFYYCKMVYIFICLGFLMTCACLLLGVVIRKLHPILCFIWYGFIFNMIALAIAIAAATFKILKTGDISFSQTAKVLFAILWWMIFMYLLTVVNSYKLKVWYRTMGFGL